MPGGYVVRDANGQALAYVYSRANEHLNTFRSIALPAAGDPKGRQDNRLGGKTRSVSRSG
jgi:hypothetical protein